MPADYIRDLLNYSANLYGSQSEYGNGVLDLSYALEINDDFKKLYNKYIDKEEKNQKQKEKQKNKFWGKVLKEIPENEKAVEIFTGIEIVEGMWGKDDHMGLVNFAWQATGLSFTQEQMKILLFACKYPDASTALAGMYDNPYHGLLWRGPGGADKVVGNSNYLANYIYLTKIAANAGNTSGLSQTGIQSVDKARIDVDISATRLGGEEWADVFKKIDGNIVATEGNIKLFIYGIAMHQVGDIFAHSAWADLIHPVSGRDGIQRIKHWDPKTIYADKIDVFPKRYDAAKQVMKNVLGKVYSSSVGTINDFAISTYYCGNTDTTRFYLGNLLQYASEADPVVYNSWVNANSICINEYRYLDLQNNCTDYFFD